MAYSGVDLSNRLFFVKLLCRWTGSVWQLLWIDLIAFTLLYIFINLIYRFALNASQMVNFENFVRYVQKLGTLTSLSFLLGFYVSTVIGRWWNVCMTVPWMNAPAFYTMALMDGLKIKGVSRKIRLTILRYMNLSWILGIRTISLQLYNRFRLPEEEQSAIQRTLAFKVARKVGKNVTTLVTEGKLHRGHKEKMSIRRRLERINADPIVKKYFSQLITEEEIESFVQIAERSEEGPTYQGEYWIPLQWCTRLVSKAKDADLIASSNRQYTMMIKMLNSFRGSLGTLSIYNDFTIPLVYTQVVVIAVYAFFLAEIFTAQQLDQDDDGKDTNNDSFDHYIPIFSLFKFILFMGWFKTAICLMNPLGDDHHSIPTSELLDYNLMVSLKSGASEDYLYPEYLSEEGDACEQISGMLDRVKWKSSSEDIEDIDYESDVLQDADKPPESKELMEKTDEIV